MGDMKVKRHEDDKNKAHSTYNRGLRRFNKESWGESIQS